MSYLLYGLGFLLLVLQGSAVIIFQNGRIKPDAPRVGIDPGYLNWRRLWKAKMDYYINGKKIVKKAYNEFKDKHYQLQMLSDDVLVVAPKFISELETLPEATLSKHYSDRDDCTGVYGDPALIEMLRTSIPHIIASQAKELEQTFSDDLLSLKNVNSDEYTPHNLSQVAFLATTKLSAHFLVGHPLCCDPGVISSILQFNFAAEARELSLIPIPKIFHSWIEPIIYPTWRKASETYRLLTSAYFPIPLYIISARIRLRRILFDTPENKEKAQDHTVFKHLATNLDRKNENNVVNKMLRLSGSMSSATMLSITRALYDLCIRSENIEKLRVEAQQALESTGGKWTMDTVNVLRHMDSFIKESMRVKPPSHLGFRRIVNCPIKLSDGTILPPEQPICMALVGMGKDETYYSNPTEFHPDRFYSPPLSYTSPPSDTTSPSASPHLLSDIEPGNLNWGAGRFACPGRWYAAAMMKLVVAMILLKYDIKFPEGQNIKASKCSDCGQKKAFEHDILVRKRVENEKIDEDYVEVSRRNSGNGEDIRSEKGGKEGESLA